MAVNFSSDTGTRNGMIWPVEGDHVYMVALSGYKGDHPPTTEKEFLEFAQSLGVRCEEMASHNLRYISGLVLCRITPLKGHCVLHSLRTSTT